MEIPQELADLRQRMEHWHSEQSGRQKLPPAIWSGAAALALRRGVTRVARVLRMNVSVLRSKSEKRREFSVCLRDANGGCGTHAVVSWAW